MNRVKYLTKDLLVKLNSKALRGKLNRSLKNLGKLHSDTWFPVVGKFICDDRIIRCRIALSADENGIDQTAQLDMTIEDYDSLPVTNVS